MKAIEEIKRQQIGMEGKPAWMIGQQLIDIIRENRILAQIVEEDLQNKDMSLKNCAEAMKKHADELQKKSGGNCVCIPPDEAEKVIRKFYGLPDPGKAPVPIAESTRAENILDLSDFL